MELNGMELEKIYILMFFGPNLRNSDHSLDISLTFLRYPLFSMLKIGPLTLKSGPLTKLWYHWTKPVKENLGYV